LQLQANVETLKSPRGVMTAGRWRSAMEMAAILDRQKQAYDAEVNSSTRPP
jgi:hypothetical protein